MRKSITLLAACGLALGATACGKHDAAATGNVSEADNMLVPADENSGPMADTGNAAAATGDETGNGMGAGTAGGQTGAAAMGGGATSGSAAPAGGTGSGASGGQ